MNPQGNEDPIPGSEATGSVIRNCQVCNLPLAEWQQSLTSQIYHKDTECTLCVYCHNNVSYARIGECVKYGSPVSHSPCRDRALQQEFEMKPVTITQGHLNMLNRLIQFGYRPRWPELTIEENVNLAGITAKEAIVNMTMEEKFCYQKMVENVAAIVSIAVHNDKEKITLAVQKKDLEKYVKVRDLQKVLSAEELRTLQEKERIKSNEKKREKNDPQLRATNKLLDDMVKKMHIPREQAEAILNSKREAK